MNGCGHTEPSSDPRYVWACVAKSLHSVGHHVMQRVPAEPEEFDHDMLTNELEREEAARGSGSE